MAKHPGDNSSIRKGVPYKLLVVPAFALLILYFAFFSGSEDDAHTAKHALAEKNAAPLSVDDKQSLKVRQLEAQLRHVNEELKRKQKETAEDAKERRRKALAVLQAEHEEGRRGEAEGGEAKAAHKAHDAEAHKAAQQGGIDDVEEGTKECYFVTGIGAGDKAVQGHYFETARVVNGAPVFRRTGGAWLQETNYMARMADGRWVLSVGGDTALSGSGSYVSADTADLPDGVGMWQSSVNQKWVPVAREFEVQRREAHLCYTVPLLDNKVDTSAEAEAIAGVNYKSTYSIPTEMKSGGDRYAYPADPAKRALTYVEDLDLPRKVPHVVLSNIPKVVFFPRMATDEECDAIVHAADHHISRSGVVPHKGSKDKTIQDVRTSSHTWLTGSTPAVQSLTNRIMASTGFGVHDGEALQVLRYQHLQKYDAHHDYFDPALYGKQTTNRAITCFIYLDDVEEGGETVCSLV